MAAYDMDRKIKTNSLVIFFYDYLSILVLARLYSELRSKYISIYSANLVLKHKEC